VFRRPGESFRGGVAIGDHILDLSRAIEQGAFTGTVADIARLAARPHLNDFMAAGGQAWSELRAALSRLLRQGSAKQSVLESCLIAQSLAEYAVPARIGDYTDFYTSIHHATAVGSLFRPDNPLLPNYKWVPIGYHGRSSSIGVSFQEFVRPVGQLLPPGASAPVVAPCARLDYELELGVFVGPGNALGTRVDIDQAEEHIFGVCLLNDWSARDIQAWEYQPLGPFLSKNFATTISPWIVTLDALAPYRMPWQRPAGDPQPLPYLDSPRVRDSGAIDIRVQALLETASMRASKAPPAELSSSSFKHAYWTIGQMVTHHTVNGCNLQPGDLLGTGTQSGPSPGEAGSLLELSRGGKQPVTLPNGEQRTFLQDGDAVIMRAHCERAGFARIGFGVAAGRVLPAREHRNE
jgi:fumarylacetoacetase